MGLSLEKLFPKTDPTDEGRNEWLDIQLAESRLKISPDDPVGERLEECWPSFAFLKGMGFENVIFRTREAQVIEDWAYRIESYEQNYIQDPEYLHVTELIWNEKDQDGNLLIECIARKTPAEALMGLQQSKPIFAVPPLQAPLGIDSYTAKAFVDEVRNTDASDTLHRVQALLKEYSSEKTELSRPSWNSILIGVLSLCLREGYLERARSLVEEFDFDFKEVWQQDDLVKHLLSAYEPKSAQIEAWSKIFSSFQLESIVRMLKNEQLLHLRPQLIKLIHQKAKREHEKLIEICCREITLQRDLLPCLAPYWSVKHYRLIHQSFQDCLTDNERTELIPQWLQALLKSYQQQALVDLEKLFVPKSFWKSFSFKKQVRLTRSQQAFVLSGLSDTRSAEILQLLKEIKPHLDGQSVDHVEKIIQSYRAMRN